MSLMPPRSRELIASARNFGLWRQLGWTSTRTDTWTFWCQTTATGHLAATLFAAASMARLVLIVLLILTAGNRACSTTTTETAPLVMSRLSPVSERSWAREWALLSLISMTMGTPMFSLRTTMLVMSSFRILEMGNLPKW